MLNLYFSNSKDIEKKEEGTRHILILYNVRMDQAGTVDFQAANAKSSAQLRVRGERLMGAGAPFLSGGRTRVSLSIVGPYTHSNQGASPVKVFCIFTSHKQ